MNNVEHLAKEISKAGTGVDNLAVYESVELAIIVSLVRMMEGTCGNLGNVFGVTQIMNGLFRVSSPLAEGLRSILMGPCD